MYIRRKVFSKVESVETGEVKLFSVNEVNLSEGTEKLYSVLMDEEELALYSEFQRAYSEGETPRRKLKDVKSHRGLGRAAILGLPSMIGGYSGKMAANDADEKGLSDKEILRKAKKRGAIVGAAGGAAVGLLSAAKHPVIRRNPPAAAALGTLASGAVSAGLGALGGRAGASKNTRVRLDKRKRDY